jgi:hypothetical protein
MPPLEFSGERPTPSECLGIGQDHSFFGQNQRRAVIHPDGRWDNLPYLLFVQCSESAPFAGTFLNRKASNVGAMVHIVASVRKRSVTL